MYIIIIIIIPLIPVTLTPEYPPPARGIDTAERSSLKYFATPTGAEKRTLSEMQRRRFQNVQEDEGEMKRDSIHDLLLRELTRGENTGKQLITFSHSNLIVFFVDGRLIYVYVFLMASERVLFKTGE